MIKYRPEIDGLRAIAVIYVIIYHSKIKIFNIDFFSGGFLGVDIFFVISGYLISSIILTEINKTNKFSYKNFYERRVRRIIPALLVVIIFSIFFNYLILLPEEFSDFLKSIFSSIFFFSNYYFYYSGSNYLAIESYRMPFLHSWSLSVEEQFYILFPIFYLFIFRYLKKYILEILALVILCSLIFSDLFSKINPSLNFYSLSSRVFELLIGSLLSYLELKKKNFIKLDNFKLNVLKKDHKFTNLLYLYCPCFGFFLISISVFLFNDRMLLPSYYSLMPLIGTCLIIFFSNKNDFISKILSNKILVFFGVISYSLYLWHYPIFAFGWNLELYFEKVSKKFILLTIILSIISFYLIEKPFRNKKIISSKLLFKILTIASLSIILFIFYGINQNGLPKRFPDLIKNSTKDNLPLVRLEKELDQTCGKNGKEKDFCQFKTNIKKINTVFLIGDSNIGSMSFVLKDMLLMAGYDVILMYRNNCYFLPNFNLFSNETNPDYPCDSLYQERRLKKIYDHPNSIIITGGMLDVYVSSPKIIFKHISNSDIKILDGYNDNLISLLEKNYTIIQLDPFIRYDKNVLREIKNFFYKSREIKIVSIDFSEFLEKNKVIMDFFKSIQHPNFYRVYTHDLFCNTELKNKCIFNNKNNIFIYDTSHPTSAGSELISKKIMLSLSNLKYNLN